MVDLSAGFFKHSTFTQTMAYRSDGSTASWADDKFRHIYLAQSNELVLVNHVKHTVSRREPVVWNERPFRRKDGTESCASAIRHSGSDFHSTRDSQFEGIPVKVWERGDGWYWHEDVYLAPSMDCARLKSYSIRRNQFFIPTNISSWEAVSIRIGEPDEKVFAIPADYREVVDRYGNRLRELLQAGSAH